MKTYDITHIGKRSNNQDQVSITTKNDHQILALVCDGMGGHNSGELASKIVCEYIRDCFRMMPVFQGVDEAKQWLKNVILDANRLTKRQAMTSLVHSGMGTTVVASLIYQQSLFIASVGDSRCYYINHQIIQLTEDDTFVNELIKSGVITKEEAIHHPKRNVLMKAVGVNDELEVEVNQYPLQAGYLLLCSDGLYNVVSEQQIFDIVKANNSLEDKCKILLQTALNQNGTDNITVALVEVEGGDIDDE